MTDRQTPNSIDDRASDDHTDDRQLRLLNAPNEAAGRPAIAPERPLAFAYLEIRHEDSCLKLRGLRCTCVPELVARWKPAVRSA